MGDLVTVVTAKIVKRCPYLDEIDRGTVSLTFCGDAPELHGLAEALTLYRNIRVSHEDLTRALAETWLCSVTTSWRTAGLRITCTVEGNERLSSRPDFPVFEH